jgi:rhamnose utilization protein RhaD (predicted bifunctional aldolase and dehydrogenase)
LAADRAPDLAALVELCRFAGDDPLLAQGGGGNASVKGGAAMAIKASGFRLSEVREDRGHVAVDLSALLALLDDPALAGRPPREAQDEGDRRARAAAIPAEVPPKSGTKAGLRPSLEALFHALLPPAVLHLHPVAVNAAACLEGGEELSRTLFPGAGWVPYAPPGYLLAKEVERVAGRGRGSRVLVLASHGFVAAGPGAGEALALMRDALAAAGRFFGPLPAGAAERVAPSPALAEAAEGLAREVRGAFPGAAATIRPASFRGLCDAARSPGAGSPGGAFAGGALSPDEVVYGVHRPVVLPAGVTPARWLRLSPGEFRERMAIVVPGEGVLLAGPGEGTVAAMEETLLASVLVRRLIARAGRPVFLSPAEVEFLSAMDSERYRQKVSQGAGAPPGKEGP